MTDHASTVNKSPSPSFVIGSFIVSLGLIFMIYRMGWEPVSKYRECRKIQSVEVCVLFSGIEP